MTAYNHAFTVAFTIITNDEQAENISNEQFTNAMLSRIIELNKNSEWDEAVGAPFDTYFEADIDRGE